MNHKFASLLTAFLGALLVTAITHAQTYKWTDGHGRICFTDDLSRVPEKYIESQCFVSVNWRKSQSKNGGCSMIRTDQHTRTFSREGNHKEPLIWPKSWSDRGMRYRTNGPRT